MAMPGGRGLFRRAIAQSGSGMNLPAPTLAQSEAQGTRLARMLGAASLAALRAVPADRLVRLATTMRWGPTVDGVTLPADPARAGAQQADVPVLTGLTADEGSGMQPDSHGRMTPPQLARRIDGRFGTLAAQARNLFPATTDAKAMEAGKRLIRDEGLAATYLWARDRTTATRQPVYAYLFSHVEPGHDPARWGAFHSSDIPYVFGTLAASARPFGPRDHRLSRRMTALWARFVATGDPNGPGMPPWPRLTAGAPQVLEFGDTIRARPLLDDATRALYDAVRRGGGTVSLF